MLLRARWASSGPLALRFPVHVLHVHFEVVVAGELLVAQLALRHGPVRIVGQLVPAEHLLQAERQVANLSRDTEKKRNAQKKERIALCK